MLPLRSQVIALVQSGSLSSLNMFNLSRLPVAERLATVIDLVPATTISQACVVATSLEGDGNCSPGSLCALSVALDPW
jgi:hypothetical protein